MVRRGLQTEVLLSLALVMATATGILAALMLETHASQVRLLRELAARGLLAAAETPLAETVGAAAGVRWWVVGMGGRARPRGEHGLAIDPASLELAEVAREQGAPLLQAGPPWEPIRFASPLASGGEVAVAWLPAASSRLLVLGLLLGDVMVFTAFGASLLRRRLVLPLARLSAAVRGVAGGALGARVPVDGARETAELAAAFNEMTEALEARTQALEKAVADLRESNHSLREARAGLDRAERLASVGRLAAGVAHEVGNPMGALLAFVDLAGRDPGLADSGREYLRRAQREGERVRVILRQLLDFARPKPATRVPVDLLRLCEETAALVRAQRRYAGIAIEVAATGEPPPAHTDPDAVRQILLNLLLNAADALRGVTPAPCIRVSIAPAVARVRAGEEPAAARDRRHADAVACRVEDNGPGILPEDRERIFDPFYTTKPPGEGTGLGLANALRLAEELAGALVLLDTPECAGACFELRLPAEPGERGVRARRPS